MFTSQVQNVLKHIGPCKYCEIYYICMYKFEFEITTVLSNGNLKYCTSTSLGCFLRKHLSIVVSTCTSTCTCAELYMQYVYNLAH